MISVYHAETTRTVLVDRVVNEAKFARSRARTIRTDSCRADPRPRLRLFKHIGEGEPRLDHGVEVLMARVQRVRRRLHAGLVGPLRPEREAGGSGRLERIDHMQIVGP